MDSEKEYAKLIGGDERSALMPFVVYIDADNIIRYSKNGSRTTVAGLLEAVAEATRGLGAHPPSWYIENYPLMAAWERKDAAALGLGSSPPRSLLMTVCGRVPVEAGASPVQVAFHGARLLTRVASSESEWGWWQEH